MERPAPYECIDAVQRAFLLLEPSEHAGRSLDTDRQHGQNRHKLCSQFSGKSGGMECRGPHTLTWRQGGTREGSNGRLRLVSDAMRRILSAMHGPRMQDECDFSRWHSV